MYPHDAFGDAPLGADFKLIQCMIAQLMYSMDVTCKTGTY